MPPPPSLLHLLPDIIVINFRYNSPANTHILKSFHPSFPFSLPKSEPLRTYLFCFSDIITAPPPPSIHQILKVHDCNKQDYCRNKPYNQTTIQAKQPDIYKPYNETYMYKPSSETNTNHAALHIQTVQ